MRLTKDAAQAGQLLSIDLLPYRPVGDHVIIGDGRPDGLSGFISLKEQGVF